MLNLHGGNQTFPIDRISIDQVARWLDAGHQVYSSIGNPQGFSFATSTTILRIEDNSVVTPHGKIPFSSLTDIEILPMAPR